MIDAPGRPVDGEEVEVTGKGRGAWGANCEGRGGGGEEHDGDAVLGLASPVPLSPSLPGGDLCLTLALGILGLVGACRRTGRPRKVSLLVLFCAGLISGEF